MVEVRLKTFDDDVRELVRKFIAEVVESALNVRKRSVPWVSGFALAKKRRAIPTVRLVRLD